MLARANAGGLPPEDAVAILIDQRDPLGLELAEAAAMRAGLDCGKEAQQVEARGEIPTVIVVVPSARARTLFRDSHPEVARGLARCPPAGRVRVVAVAEGAAMPIQAEVSSTRGVPTGSRS
jgi:hypothetical protein